MHIANGFICTVILLIFIKYIINSIMNKYILFQTSFFRVQDHIEFLYKRNVSEDNKLYIYFTLFSDYAGEESVIPIGEVEHGNSTTASLICKCFTIEFLTFLEMDNCFVFDINKIISAKFKKKDTDKVLDFLPKTMGIE